MAAGAIASVAASAAPSIWESFSGLFEGGRERLCSTGIGRSQVEAAVNSMPPATRSRFEQLYRQMWTDIGRPDMATWRGDGGAIDEDFLCRTTWDHLASVRQMKLLLADALGFTGDAPVADPSFNPIRRIGTNILDVVGDTVRATAQGGVGAGLATSEAAARGSQVGLSGTNPLILFGAIAAGAFLLAKAMS